MDKVFHRDLGFGGQHRHWVVMLLENNPYPQDVRVREEARSLALAGYRVTVVAPLAAGQPRREVIAGVEVRRFWLFEAGGKVGAFLVEFLIASVVLQLAALGALARGADVLHLHNPPDTLFLAGWAARRLGRDVVFDHHDLTPELVTARTGAKWARRIAQWCERRTFRVASIVLSANHSHAKIAVTRGGKGIEDVYVVRNGPPATTLSPGAPIRTGALLDPHLVYVGAVAHQDDAQDLPELLALLRDRHGVTDARLTIVGDGPAHGAVLAAAIRQDVVQQITITGWLNHEQVPPIIRDADICVDPARPTPVNDGSTMVKIAEYLAAGRPVAAYRLRETRRTAVDAAYFAEGCDVVCLSDCVATLARDERLRTLLAERARRRAPLLTWERSEQELLKAYSRISPECNVMRAGR